METKKKGIFLLREFIAMKTRGPIILQQGNQIITKTKQQPKRWTRKYQQQSCYAKMMSMWGTGQNGQKRRNES